MTLSRRQLRVRDVQTIRLHHLDGPRRGECDEVRLVCGATALLGRTPDADILFPDTARTAVSRRHALLWLASNEACGWHVLDLDSTCGTHLNGRRVRVRRLAHGDVLMLGRAGPVLLVEL